MWLLRRLNDTLSARYSNVGFGMEIRGGELYFMNFLIL